MVKNTKSSTKSAFNKSVSKKATPKSSIAAKSAKVALSSNSANKKSVKVAKTEKVANFKRNRMIVIAVLVITFIGIPSFLYGRSAYEKHQDKQKFLQLAEDMEKLKTDIEKQYGIVVTEQKECHYFRSVYKNRNISCGVRLSSLSKLSKDKVNSVFENNGFKIMINSVGIFKSVKSRTEENCTVSMPKEEEILVDLECSGNAKDFYYQKID